MRRTCLQDAPAQAAQRAAAVAYWQEIADLYAAGNGEYPSRFALSALVARLLGEQQRVTERWAIWAEQIAGWDKPSDGTVERGVQTLRAVGMPFERRSP